MTLNDLCKREHRRLFLALHADAKTYPGGISGLAREMGINGNTLTSQLNADSDHKPPAFSHIIELIVLTGGRRSIYAMCQLVGKVPMEMPMQDRSQEEAIRLFLKLVGTASKTFDTGSEAAADGVFCARERAVLEPLLLELLVATGELLNSIRASE